MEAMTLRSTDTRKATPGRSEMMIPKILARRQRIYGFVSSAKIDFKKMPSKALEGLALALSTQGLFLIFHGSFENFALSGLLTGHTTQPSMYAGFRRFIRQLVA